MAVFTAVSCHAASEYERERYNVIVDRSPFGTEELAAPEPDTSVQDAAAAQAASKELRLCFLLESEDGEIRAGFENKTAKAGDPKSIMLMVGESFRGMKLLNIDLENSRATLQRNGSRVLFSLTKPAAAATAAKKSVAQPQRRFGGGFRRQPPQQPQKPPEPELSPEEQAKKREEVRENLRQYQMEVIRAGMPPLPIPLTQEMDDQLVSEGILPPGSQ
ncbi:MAG: hypothetical protein HKP10_03800 [Kiritimatiellales bacterium]|nr:hypothetical protein [Pontiella sp.]NNJ70394.1 hypothetical protein [Kiritimatiellales bacterium]